METIFYLILSIYFIGNIFSIYLFFIMNITIFNEAKVFKKKSFQQYLIEDVEVPGWLVILLFSGIWFVFVWFYMLREGSDKPISHYILNPKKPQKHKT